MNDHYQSKNENDFFRYHYYRQLIIDSISLSKPSYFDYDNITTIIMDYFYPSTLKDETVTIIDCGGNSNFSIKDNVIIEIDSKDKAELRFVYNLSYISEELEIHYEKCLERFKNSPNELSKLDYTYLQLLFFYNYFPEKNGFNRNTNQQYYRGIFVKSEINDNVMSFRSSVCLKRPVQFIYVISNHPIQKLYKLYLKYKDENNNNEKENYVPFKHKKYEDDEDKCYKITTKIYEEDDEYIKSFKEKIRFCTEFMNDDEYY